MTNTLHINEYVLRTTGREVESVEMGPSTVHRDALVLAVRIRLLPMVDITEAPA